MCLEGAISGKKSSPDRLANTDDDGRPLLARYDLIAARTRITAENLRRRREGGLWRWHELLPVRHWRHVRYLGEGSTPVLEPLRLARHLGLTALYVKAESLNPTGSFKSRGMAVAVSRALELGCKQFIVPSAGNAAGALAAYSAAAGIPATVVMPADAPRSNQVEVLSCGARLILLDGLISDCGRFARQLGSTMGAFDFSTLKEPYRLEGKKTMGLELAEDFSWKLPDAVIYPTGGGTGLIGMWKAFDELEALGLIGAARPKMFSIQAAGCAPIVRAFEAGVRFAEPVATANTRAAGIRVPGGIGDFLILDAIRASHGAAVAVEEKEIAEMQMKAGSMGLGFVGLETAAALAAVPELLESRLIDRDDRVVVFDTGSGFKSLDPDLDKVTRVVKNDPSTWDEEIAAFCREQVA